MQKHKHLLALAGLAVVAAVGLSIRAVLANAREQQETVSSSRAALRTVSVPVETASADDLHELNSAGASWSGEVLSTSDVAIHPSREGQIAEWYVRLGDRVWEGQSLGRLAAPPATLELASALAEQAKTLVLARAQAEATARLVSGEKLRLAGLKASLGRSRDAAIGVSETEREQARLLIPLRKQAVRATIERLARSLPAAVAANGSSPASPEAVATLQFKLAFGLTNEAAKNEYRDALHGLLSALRDPDAIPEADSLTYANAGQKLLAYSLPADGVSEERLSELRTALSEEIGAFTDAMREYKESLSGQITKGSEQAMVTAEADLELARQEFELAAKIAELDREQEMANAEVRGAEAAYASIASGIAGQEILAPRSGVVSAIFKNVGDHVAPDTVMAGLSGSDARSRFVRFRIPSDQRSPDVGETVRVERPGFPFGGKKATVIGAGIALDDNGFYAADAEFQETVDWPVHSSVRVVVTHDDAHVLIPFSAVWWDDAGAPNVWLVMENGVIRSQAVKIGRAVGDRVEAEDGLEPGDRFVSKAGPDLKTGASVYQEAEKVDGAAKEGGESGDGHGHSHDE